jgi:hypothetical protein
MCTFLSIILFSQIDSHLWSSIFVFHSLENGYTIVLSSINHEMQTATVRSRLCRKFVQHFSLLICAEKLAFVRGRENAYKNILQCWYILEIHREFPPQTVVQKIQKYHISAQSPEKKAKRRLFMYWCSGQKIWNFDQTVQWLALNLHYLYSCTLYTCKCAVLICNSESVVINDFYAKTEAWKGTEKVPSLTHWLYLWTFIFPNRI